MSKRVKLTPEERLVRDRLALVEDLRRKFGRDDFALLMREGGFARVTSVCPTGISVLDHHVVGIGGLPYGRLVELHGEEGSGKTTLLSALMAAAQRDGTEVAFQDSENKFNMEWAAVHGCDVGAIVQLQAATVEEFHDTALYLVDRAARRPLMIALDSIANLPTARELAEGKDIPAEHAALWTRFLRPFTQRVARRQALVVFVNQPRSKVGVMFGPTETTFAGRALRHAYSLRLRVSHGKGIREGGEHLARYMHVAADKNQLAPPHRSCTLKLDYREGFDDDWATVDHAKGVGCLEKERVFSPAAVREARANLGWPAPPAPPPAPEPASEAA